MKALSIKQPWAGLIAHGLKTIETRTWQTHYRGDLLICASQKPAFNVYNEFSELENKLNDNLLINGHAICIVELYHVEMMRKEHEKAAMCEIYPYAFSWHLRNIRIIEPVAVKGKLSLFNVEF